MKLTKTQAGLLVVVAAILLLGMDWGLPSKERNALLTYGLDLTGRDFAALDSLNARYFSARDSVDAEAEAAVRSGSRPVAHTPTEVGPVLSWGEKLAGYRRFLLGSCAVDERKPFIALARMNPARIDLDPRGFMYGGAYLYPLGLTLKAAGMLGLTTLSMDPAHALAHPREVALLYLVGRAFSVAAFLGIAILLVHFCALLEHPKAGTPAMFAWCCSTLAINQALVCKPHVLAAFFTLLGVTLLLRFRAEPGRASLVWAGAFLGLAAGSSFPALGTWIFLPALLVRARSDRPVLRDLTVGLGCAMGAFLLTNPYLLLDPAPFLATVWHHGGSAGWSYAIASPGKLWSFAGELALRRFAFPLSLVGLGTLGFSIARGRGVLHRVAWNWLLVSVALGAAISNSRILLFLGPILCAFAGIGLASLQSSLHPARLATVLTTVICLAALPQFALVAYDFVNDRQWYRPTLDWVRESRLNESISIGLFDRPEPVNHPPFPFLRSRVVNLNAYADSTSPPDVVILGNFFDDRQRWASHPLRQMYRLSRELGYRKSFDAGLTFRTHSESRVAAWIYERTHPPRGSGQNGS